MITMTTKTAQVQTLADKIGDIGEQIGGTPLLHFPTLSTGSVKVYAKAEWTQLSGSVKARAAYGIIREAIESGKLTQGVELLDASSGNTAIAYGAICAKLDIACTICLPRNASQRRIELLNELGVHIHFTSPFEGTEGAQREARELNAAHAGRFYYADQYSNEANWKAHYNGTALEILDQTFGEITHFVAGLGTTGTFTGTARKLKEELAPRCIALQPDTALHILEGWKHLETADIPGIYDNALHDEVLPIDADSTIAMMQHINKAAGLRLSPSSAANLVGAKAVADTLKEGVVVTVLPDSIDRYKELEQEVFGR